MPCQYDTRSMSKVAPFVNSSDWQYEVYLSPNGNLKRAMGVSTSHTFLLNKNKRLFGNINHMLKEMKKNYLRKLKKYQNS